MIDTVKLQVEIEDPDVLDNLYFQPVSAKQLKTSYRGSRTYYNPPKSYAKQGIYMPNLTLYKRPNRSGRGVTYSLSVEFSASKMLFGNNFDEPSERDFHELVNLISNRIFELSEYRIPCELIKKAKVNGWHPAKNIAFMDSTSVQTVIGAIAKLDISRVYDLQRTSFRDGHVLHVHTNCLDIAIYDKMADLRKAKISDKRAVENNNLIQLNRLEKLRQHCPLEVLRLEVRYSGVAVIKRAYPELESWNFEDLFKAELCKKTLTKHWMKLTSSVDLLALDQDKAYELLQNYLKENPSATPQSALAAVTGLLIVNQEGASSFRNTLESVFNVSAWYRIKKLLNAPSKYRYKSFIKIEEDLKEFRTIRLNSFLNSIEITGN